MKIKCPNCKNAPEECRCDENTIEEGIHQMRTAGCMFYVVAAVLIIYLFFMLGKCAGTIH